MRAKAFGWLAGSLVLCAAPAAGVSGDPFDMRTACRADFWRFCSELGNAASRSEIYRCLARHEDEVSAGCRIALGEEADGGEYRLPAERPPVLCREGAPCPEAPAPPPTGE